MMPKSLQLSGQSSATAKSGGTFGDFKSNTGLNTNQLLIIAAIALFGLLIWKKVK